MGTAGRFVTRRLTLWPSSLRGRVLALFAIVAVVPILGLGLRQYSQARLAVDRIISAQTSAGVARAAAEMSDRVSMVQSDGELLANNAETQRLFSLLPSGDSARIGAARAQADTFVQRVWQQVKNAYVSVELRDSRGATVERFDQSDISTALSSAGPLPAITQAILDSRSRQRLGMVVLAARQEALLPRDIATSVFGHSGHLLILDRASGRIVFDTRRPLLAVDGAPSPFGTALSRLSAESGQIRYTEGDSERLASFAVLRTPAWTLISSTSVAEFTAGLADAQRVDLVLALVLAGVIAAAFAVLLGRTTRSLEELTLAADLVGRGDLNPRLPETRDGEVGALAGAFETMTVRVRTMMGEMELSRQLAVLGEFSARLSHEIRNPLTSLKMNLQGLSRDVNRGRITELATPPLETCLREVDRLDATLRGVLELARPRSTWREQVSIHETLERVLALLAPQLGAHGIRVDRSVSATNARVAGDSSQLAGLFMNLLINAIDAQPQGGRIVVATATRGLPGGAPAMTITIADDGPGIPRELRDEIFRPFVSTKATGTGLGLPVAANTARDHGGSLTLAETPDGIGGAAFVVELPTSAEPGA